MAFHSMDRRVEDIEDVVAVVFQAMLKASVTPHKSSQANFFVMNNTFPRVVWRSTLME